ncbi:MAG TPA: TetR/AcrR family transcriptional regulator [Rhizomicrobium sp.]|nr:TetR/AcrR family transcriptional regulator [Rhizomicrobium sp.]
MTKSALKTSGRFADEARHLGKSARTRARLMDAAVGIFAREGFEAASVNQIAQAAEVVNGTFYIHFRDKDDIASAVTYRIAADITRQLDEAMADIDDAVERTSAATRRFIEFASAQPEWGLALCRAVWSFRDLRENVITYLRSDLKRGARQGAFTVPIDDFLIDTFASMTMGALFARISGTAGVDAGQKVAELQLRMLGVTPARAKKAAWRELLKIELSIGHHRPEF